MKYTIDDIIWAFEPFLSESDVDVVNSKFGYFIILRDQVANNFVMVNQVFSTAEDLSEALIECVKCTFAAKKMIDSDKIIGSLKEELDDEIEIYLSRLKTKAQTT